MEHLNCMIKGLTSPWGERNRALLVDFETKPPLTWDGMMQQETFAQVFDISDGLKCHLGSLMPFNGLGYYKPDFEIVVQGHRCNNFQVGTWIGFKDFEVVKILNSQVWVNFTASTKVWTIPEFERSFPVCFLHLFCGGFNGWERATKWMEENRIFTIQKEIAIDFNEQAMQIWQMRSQGFLWYGNISKDDVCTNKHTGIIASCEQSHWMNLCRFLVNGFFTCSPPCPSWSRAGKNQGLECEGGLAFSESIAKIRCLRPNLVFFECADKIVSHPHYNIIKMSLKAAGYKPIWSNVVPYEKLAHMFRTRWLAVWARQDVSDVQALGSFKLADVQKIGWDSTSYDFPVPSQLQHQLNLTGELCEIYGNHSLLPPSKKSGCDSPNVVDTLNRRCIKGADPLPTLCARYSQQHLIDKVHLQNKGIFASIQCIDGRYQFLSPLRFVALLGAVVSEPTFVPVKIAPAFLHIGNAISVPHAVLTLSVGLLATKFIEISVSQVVLKAWEDRLTTSNTIILKCRDFIVMCPLQCIRTVLPIHHLCDSSFKAVCGIRIDSTLIKIDIGQTTTILEVFKRIGFEKCALKNVMCSTGGKAVTWDSKVIEVDGLSLSLVKCGQPFLSFSIECSHDPSVCDSLDCAILSEIVQIEETILKASSHPILPCIDSQFESQQCKRVCIRSEPDVKTQRISLFVHQGIPLATDELDWIVKHLAPKQHLHITPVVSNDWLTIESTITEIVAKCVARKIIKCMILFENHWFGIEIRKECSIEFFCINVPKNLRTNLSLLFQRLEGNNGFKGSFGFSESTYCHGFCGWELLINCFGITGPQFDSRSREILQFINEHGPIAGVKPSERFLIRLWEIICSIRFHFLETLPINHCIDGIRIGLAKDDHDMAQSPSKEIKPLAADPWLQPSEDPWNQAKKSCKWEDLKLPEDHHFQNQKGSRIVQLHRHQITANTAGIAFATKNSVPEVFALSPPKQTALLLPNSDKLSFPQLPQLSITGPFEIVVRDQGLNCIYKRQVLLIQEGCDVCFQLPKAAYTATTTEFKELVVEIDERLVSKDLVANILAKPLETIKAKLLEQIPPLASKSLGVFGFRVIKNQSNKDSHRVFQVVCKIQADQRNACLERSGAGDAFIRDYIPKGDTIDDLTIVPRFWEIEKPSKDEALRMSSSISGFAGLVHTRRGIAVRARCKQVAAVRQILLAHDDRISKLNHSVIPRVVRDSTGWPSIVGPQEIVRATIHGTTLPPIPTRCYKAQGVTTWTLAFDSAPKIDKFMVQLNDKTYEIILTIPSEKAPSNPKAKNTKSPKGIGKGRAEPKGDIAPTSNEDANAERITSLEAKFSAMERRQDSLEGKINDGFSSVNDQLRQVLNAIQPRPNSSQTGMTPPSKVHKTS